MATNSIVIGRRSDLAPEVLAAMRRLRRSVFADRLQWSRLLIGGGDVDELDTDDCVYLVARNGAGEASSAARMFPTSRGCMLSRFPQLLGSAAVPSDPGIWELGCFATSLRFTREGRHLTLSRATIELLDLVLLYAQRCRVRRLVLVTPVSIETLLLRTKVEVHRISQPAVVGDVLCVALYIDVPASDCVAAKSRSVCKSADTVPAALESVELTRGQLAVMRWVVAGKTAEEIGQILSITKHGVVAHISKVKVSLQAKNTAQAVARAVALGLV